MRSVRSHQRLRDGGGGVSRDLLSRFVASGVKFHLDGASDWSVSPETLDFIAGHTPTGAATLETGAGLSTILFAALGARHICITPDADEIHRIGCYCGDEGIDLGQVRFVNAPSDQVLPTLETPPLDLVLIDGGHGFPMPIMDWYYTAEKLKEGGVLIVDDTHLWPCAALVDFLKHEPRWTLIGAVGRRTAAFRKTGPFVYQEFCFQPYVVRRSRLSTGLTHILAGWDLLRTGRLGQRLRRGRRS